jgi:LIM domain
LQTVHGEDPTLSPVTYPHVGAESRSPHGCDPVIATKTAVMPGSSRAAKASASGSSPPSHGDVAGGTPGYLSDDDNLCNRQPGVPLGPCADCGRQITERYYLVAVGRAWHVDGCLRCCACRQPLDGHRTCFVREGKIYCRGDYNRLVSGHCFLFPFGAQQRIL